MRQETTTGRHDSPVEAAVPAANFVPTQATRLPLQQRSRAFTLAELLISVSVLVLIVFLATQLLNSAATIATVAHKRMDADSQARQLLDRMTVDFAQMVKRSDVDYYVKSNPPAGSGGLRTVLQPGNDQIAFYSAVPGYYPSTGSQSPVSLVAYRVNSNSTLSSYNKMERLGKGLVWNAVSTADTPVVFMPIPVASPLPVAELPVPAPNPLPIPAWPQAGNMTADAAYELVGPQVFRFEYYYLLKNGSFSDFPWISPHTSPSGMQDVSAIVVDIAVIDPKSKLLLTDAQIATLSTPGSANFLADYSSGMLPGQLRANWQNTLNTNTTLPRPAISGVRLYERFIYLSPPVQ
jgi:type II secretory pathway component PulJ